MISICLYYADGWKIHTLIISGFEILEELLLPVLEIVVHCHLLVQFPDYFCCFILARRLPDNLLLRIGSPDCHPIPILPITVIHPIIILLPLTPLYTRHSHPVLPVLPTHILDLPPPDPLPTLSLILLDSLPELGQPTHYRHITSEASPMAGVVMGGLQVGLMGGRGEGGVGFGDWVRVGLELGQCYGVFGG